MVLSIDLDFILEPCIQLYNDLINSDCPNQNIMWEDIMKRRDLSRHLSVNTENWKFICDLIQRLSGKCNFYIGYDHSSLLTAIDQEIKNGLRIPFNVVNIDHHHDILYKEYDKILADKYKDANCANWAYFLGRMNLLNNYFWIKNPNSELYNKEEYGDFQYTIFHTLDKEQFDYDSLKDIDFVFITSSTPWFPREFLNYHYSMIKLVLEKNSEEKVFFLSKSFSAEREERKLFPYAR